MDFVQIGHFDAHFVDRSIAPSPGLRGVTGCPALHTIVEQLHAQHGWCR